MVQDKGESGSGYVGVHVFLPPFAARPDSDLSYVDVNLSWSYSGFTSLQMRSETKRVNWRDRENGPRPSAGVRWCSSSGNTLITSDNARFLSLPCSLPFFYSSHSLPFLVFLHQFCLHSHNYLMPPCVW